MFDHELRSADHVDVVLDRHLGKEFQILRRELGQLSGGLAGLRGFDAGEQLRREQLGKEHEVALVVRGGVEKELALLGKFVERCRSAASGTARRRCESVRRRDEIAVWHRARNPGSSIPDTSRSRTTRCRRASSWGSIPARKSRWTSWAVSTGSYSRLFDHAVRCTRGPSARRRVCDSRESDRR